jgi:hypothetical protein
VWSSVGCREIAERTRSALPIWESVLPHHQSCHQCHHRIWQWSLQVLAVFQIDQTRPGQYRGVSFISSLLLFCSWCYSSPSSDAYIALSVMKQWVDVRRQAAPVELAPSFCFGSLCCGCWQWTKKYWFYGSWWRRVWCVRLLVKIEMNDFPLFLIDLTYFPVKHKQTDLLQYSQISLLRPGTWDLNPRFRFLLTFLVFFFSAYIPYVLRRWAPENQYPNFQMLSTLLYRSLLDNFVTRDLKSGCVRTYVVKYSSRSNSSTPIS